MDGGGGGGASAIKDPYCVVFFDAFDADSVVNLLADEFDEIVD